MRTEDVVSRKSRKGAESYITRLGFPVDEWVDDSYWNGRESVAIRIRFAVERRADEYVVVRDFA